MQDKTISMDKAIFNNAVLKRVVASVLTVYLRCQSTREESHFSAIWGEQWGPLCSLDQAARKHWNLPWKSPIGLISLLEKSIKKKKMKRLLEEDEFCTLKIIRINSKEMNKTGRDSLWPRHQSVPAQSTGSQRTRGSRERGTPSVDSELGDKGPPGQPGRFGLW